MAAGFRMDHKMEGQEHRVRTWALIVKVNEYDHLIRTGRMVKNFRDAFKRCSQAHHCPCVNLVY